MENYGNHGNYRELNKNRMQYGLYQEAVILSKNSPKTREKWESVTFWVFDAPQINESFEVTIQEEKLLKSIFRTEWKF
jgi:hypothetical protein